MPLLLFNYSVFTIIFIAIFSIFKPFFNRIHLWSLFLYLYHPYLCYLYRPILLPISPYSATYITLTSATFITTFCYLYHPFLLLISPLLQCFFQISYVTLFTSMQFPMLRLFTLQTLKSASRLVTNPSRYASYVLFSVYSVNNVALISKLVFWQSSLSPRRFFLTDLHWSLDFRCLPKSGNY